HLKPYKLLLHVLLYNRPKRWFLYDWKYTAGRRLWQIGDLHNFLHPLAVDRMLDYQDSFRRVLLPLAQIRAPSYPQYNDRLFENILCWLKHLNIGYNPNWFPVI